MSYTIDQSAGAPRRVHPVTQWDIQKYPIRKIGGIGGYLDVIRRSCRFRSLSLVHPSHPLKRRTARLCSFSGGLWKVNLEVEVMVALYSKHSALHGFDAEGAVNCGGYVQFV